MIEMLPGTPARGGGNPARPTSRCGTAAQGAALTGPPTAAVTAYRWRERARTGETVSLAVGVDSSEREGG